MRTQSGAVISRAELDAQLLTELEAVERRLAAAREIRDREDRNLELFGCSHRLEQIARADNRLLDGDVKRALAECPRLAKAIVEERERRAA